MNEQFNCPRSSCHSNQTECVECGMAPSEFCTCWLEDMDDAGIVVKELHCHTCGTQSTALVDVDRLDVDRSYLSEVDEYDEYEFIDNDEDGFTLDDLEGDTISDLQSWLDSKQTGTSSKKKNKPQVEGIDFVWENKCRHFNHPIDLPDNTRVFASSGILKDRASPDFGLYLDDMWQPINSLGYVIDWQDYGLPGDFYVAAEAIIDTYNKARQGQWVEIGCIGGHGRTGTAIACMAICAGVPADKAIGWTRVNYCHHAVESPDQFWYVDWFECYIYGGKIDFKYKEKKENKKGKGAKKGYKYVDRVITFEEEGRPVDLSEPLPPKGKPEIDYDYLMIEKVKRTLSKKEKEEALAKIYGTVSS